MTQSHFHCNVSTVVWKDLIFYEHLLYGWHGLYYEPYLFLFLLVVSLGKDDPLP